MAKFDVHRLRRGDDLVIDCQADLLDALNTRFVVPLLPVEAAPKLAARLNPVFTVAGERFVMATQFAAALAFAELGERVATLRADEFVIGEALDMLISGF